MNAFICWSGAWSDGLGYMVTRFSCAWDIGVTAENIRFDSRSFHGVLR